ncbi:hypothetical protein [Weissella confusa]|uniref:Uncharacterized protein n=1 Tax=Weissella confusa TaxID=1583 RepID=A0A4Z0RWP4_WEICO|nr:hypothetical protein [Weissella confusa]TGE72871.1 hypothetical protein C6P11_05305 [Weissella confusa]
MNMRNKKLLLVTIASLSMIGVTVTTQTDPVAASPYASGVETEAVNNPKEIVINLVDEAGNPVTWTQTNGENGGSSIEYLNQDGDLTGMSLIPLPDNLVANSAITADQGYIYSVNDGKFYVDLSAISGSVAHFTLNVDQDGVAQSDVVTGTDSVPAEPQYVTSSAVVPNEPQYMTSSAMVPNEPQYMSSSAVVPNEPIVAPVGPVAPHSGASIADLVPATSATPADVTAKSEGSQASHINKPVMQKSDTSVSVAPNVIAQAASVATTTPVTASNVVSTSTPVVATPIASVVGSVANAGNQTNLATNQTSGSSVQSTPASVNATQTQVQVQAVRKPDLISSISDLPKASIWTDKARTFSAISIGMSVVAVAAQFLMTKLGFIKSFL